MTVVVSVLLVLGALFCLIAAIGVFRMPDLYMRMHAATKAGAFGGSLLVVSAALHFGTVRAAIMAVLIVGFFYLTAPVAAQVFGLAAYRRGVPLWEKSRVDRLKDSGLCEKRKSGD
jgi:multicomponent Na+:H+ antiporter subunit G